jgi:Tfp pilus assembly protein PilO
MALKKSEKSLLTVFGIALFLIGTFLGEGIFSQRRAAAEAAINKYKDDINDYETLLRDETRMLKRSDWLSMKQPRFVSEEAAATDVENHIKRCADTAAITIDSLKPTEPLEQPHYTQIALNVNVSGAAEGVTQFASLLQNRDSFFAVPSITFTTDRRDPSILRCAATVARWYAKGSSSASPDVGDFAVASQN